MTIECPRCGRECVREQRARNVWHYTCPDEACRPYREPRLLFVLGLAYEVFVLVPYSGLKAVWRRVRR